jgi:hypothetical protein
MELNELREGILITRTGLPHNIWKIVQKTTTIVDTYWFIELLVYDEEWKIRPELQKFVEPGDALLDLNEIHFWNYYGPGWLLSNVNRFEDIDI